MSDERMPARPPVLRVRDLRVSVRDGSSRPAPSSATDLLRGVSFDIGPGERVGLIGESGSGKSLTAAAVMGLLPDTLGVRGSIRLDGVDEDLVGAGDARLSALRGREMAMVFQEPMTALDPLMRAGAQVAEPMTRHRMLGLRAARARAVELLAQVRLPDPAESARAFPHQLSGGQRQRVMLAMAMANDPRLLLCDEPTTALDVTVQAEILRLIDALVEERGSSLLFISHDIAVVGELCDRVLVMHRGEIVEDGPVVRVLGAPQHPYTRRLIAASDLSAVDGRGRLRTGSSAGIVGRADAAPADPDAVPAAVAAPAVVPAVVPAAAGLSFPSVLAVPHRWRTADDERIVFAEQEEVQAGAEPLIRVRDLSREYRRSRLSGAAPVVHGLRDVSFDVQAGQRLGVVGESGSGKSTLLRILCALDRPTAGSVQVDGQEIVGARERQLRDFRKTVQIVFQDPMGSLDPRMRVRDIVAEPLRGVGRQEATNRVEAQLAVVGLEADAMGRHPHQFSGGERQRISIARALITRPRVLLADEAVSALDVSVRAQVLNLFADLADEYRLTLVFVSHDLGVIRHVTDTVAVLSEGRIVEAGPTAAVYDDPRHPYTKALVAAAPALSSHRGRAADAS